jgi:hypothetical protein
MPECPILHGDKGYDTNAIRQKVEGKGTMPNIPPKANRHWKNCFSLFLYRAHVRTAQGFPTHRHPLRSIGDKLPRCSLPRCNDRLLAMSPDPNWTPSATPHSLWLAEGRGGVCFMVAFRSSRRLAEEQIIPTSRSRFALLAKKFPSPSIQESRAACEEVPFGVEFTRAQRLGIMDFAGGRS